MNEDKAARYHRLKRQAVFGTAACGVAWLGTFELSGLSVALARAAVALTRGLPPFPARMAAVTLVVLVLATGYEAISFPLAAYGGWFLERRYGLLSQPFSRWVADHLKGFLVGTVISIGGALVFYSAVGLAGRFWWGLTAIVFAIASLGIAAVAPTLLMPLFYRFTPLERPGLTDRLIALSRRAGVRVLGVYEWGLGDKGSRANAALAGIGRTRRILVSDTLLKDYSDDEIEVILAHELAHHVHHDIWSGLALDSLLLGVSLLLAALAVPAAGDLARLPLIVLIAGAASVLLSPLANAWSRRSERRADRFALALSPRPAAFMAAMRRLGSQNLAEERPSRLIYWFFHSHPTLEERLAFARSVAEVQ